VKPIFDEMVKQQCLGWYRFFYGFKSDPPVLPFSLTVRGAVPRAPEPLRPRPTADGGAADRKPRCDSDGVQALSINTASQVPELWYNSDSDSDSEDEEGGPREPKWPKEVKPRHSDMMINLSVLMNAAEELGEPVFFFTDDASSFFNQMKLAPSEFSRCQTLLYDYHKNLMVLVQEYVMAFGLTPASNIAQRLAHMIVSVIRKNFDEVEYMRTSATV
jgi:hypothetical protein